MSFVSNPIYVRLFKEGYTLKIALVTGGSKGIGLETVIRFQELGYQVITCSRDTSVWDKAVKAHPNLSSVDYFTVDISSVEQVEAFFESVHDKYECIDIAVNNASPKLESNGSYENVETHLLYDTLVQDFWSHALCLKHELRLMDAGACIVNVSSINGLRPTPNASMYSASKHALEGLTRSVALEAINRNVRINAVAPGVTWTPRWEEKEIDNANIKSEVSDVVPIKRFAEAREVVDAIEFLSSDKASYIVGHTLVVDGGISLA